MRWRQFLCCIGRLGFRVRGYRLDQPTSSSAVSSRCCPASASDKTFGPSTANPPEQTAQCEVAAIFLLHWIIRVQSLGLLVRPAHIIVSTLQSLLPCICIRQDVRSEYSRNSGADCSVTGGGNFYVCIGGLGLRVLGLSVGWLHLQGLCCPASASDKTFDPSTANNPEQIAQPESVTSCIPTPLSLQHLYLKQAPHASWTSALLSPAKGLGFRA